FAACGPRGPARDSVSSVPLRLPLVSVVNMTDRRRICADPLNPPSPRVRIPSLARHAGADVYTRTKDAPSGDLALKSTRRGACCPVSTKGLGRRNGGEAQRKACRAPDAEVRGLPLDLSGLGESGHPAGQKRQGLLEFGPR